MRKGNSNQYESPSIPNGFKSHFIGKVVFPESCLMLKTIVTNIY